MQASANSIKRMTAASPAGTLSPPEYQLPRVAILLGVCDGEHFLAQQLDSFAVQTHGNWTVYASDDGSKDKTRSIMEAYRTQWSEEKLTIRPGPCAGFSANFLSLVCDSRIEAEYYAFSDQDDIWESTKLERALAWLQTVSADTPGLYCSRTRLVDENNNEIGFSRLFEKPPSFANALVQNIGGGNTMVFNKAARSLLMQAGPDITVVSHDWWAYILVTGCGGRVFYDPQPSVRYRQHSTNLIGADQGISCTAPRLRQQLRGRFRHWNDINLAALLCYRSRLTEENRKIFDAFREARTKNLVPRLISIRKSGVFRQTLLGNIQLLIGATLNRV